MTDDFKRQIERLLDEPGERPASPAAERLRAQLTATFSEALEERARSGTEAVDAATAAAYIDGQLTGRAREEFTAALARQPDLRADLEQAADLAYSAADKPTEVPKALLARAGAAFAPAPPKPVAPQARWSLTEALASLLPRQRMALAAVTALALLVAVPAGLILSGKFGRSGGEPELSGVEEQQQVAAKRLQECRDKMAKEARDSKPAGVAKDAAKNLTKDGKDPCEPPDSPIVAAPPAR